MATTCPPLRFEERSAEGLAADSAFWELYGASFDQASREPSAALLAGVRGGHVIVAVAEAEERTVGLAAVHLLREPPMPFLLYLAVAPELRGQRIGSALLDQVLRLARSRQKGSRGWATQVDLPELAPTAAERERRRRILIFFRSQGARPLPCTYVRPPVRGSTPSAALLLHAPAGGLPLKRTEVTALLRSIYFEKYGATNGVERRLLESLLGPAHPGAPGAFIPGALPRGLHLVE